MKLNRILVYALGLWAFAVPAESAEQEAVPTGTLVTIEGRVEVARQGSTDWETAELNQELAPGDRIRTKLRSRATIRWSELSTVRVNQLTTLEVRPPESPEKKPELDLRSGASYFFSRENPSDIQFRTPTASGAIRGTEFHLEVGEDGQTWLALLDGEVDLANNQGAVTLESGEQAVVEQGSAPRKTAALEGRSVIQWVLYYPAVVAIDDILLTAEERTLLAEPIEAYRRGDLLEALTRYPEDRTPRSEAERTFLAALLLSVGQSAEAEAQLSDLSEEGAAARALRELIRVVQGARLDELDRPTTASEWMARSYRFQSVLQLEAALEAARTATGLAPDFGPAWVRVAELEFSFGRRAQAEQALERGLDLSDRHAQGLALKGYLAAARNRPQEALDAFDRAIEVDGSLGNAWLGRGLVLFSLNRKQEGRENLQVAATLEPNRAAFRSYLGKAFAESWDPARAAKELALAQTLDPNDPTPLLYSALLNQQQNRVNRAISELEESKALNDNRAVFRSEVLLDQDKAVRSANLASIYQDAGLIDYSVQEAARAVAYDYANPSAHLFLANSFNALRDPNLFDLRYETPWFSEQLVANLLMPIGGGSLSPTVSQQEYSRFFAGNSLGIFSSTEYLSNGDWVQEASQFGTMNNTSYSLDVGYRDRNGWRANNDLEALYLGLRLKQQLSDKDSVYFDVGYSDRSGGDLAQYYDPNDPTNGASRTLRIDETLEPSLLLGYHREWSPGNHTLFLGGLVDGKLTATDPAFGYPWNLAVTNSIFGPGQTNITAYANPLASRRDVRVYSAELQQIHSTDRQSLILGLRYQAGDLDSSNPIQLPGFIGPPVTLQPTSTKTSFDRVSVYGYENLKVVDNLLFTVGLSYDYLDYPDDVGVILVDSSTTKDQVSPKVGAVWSPWNETHLRAAYTRSLGGVLFDNSVRLEPVQVAGFNQAFRSLIPESFAGSLPGARFETVGVGLDQKVGKSTYVHVAGERLWSDGTRSVGYLINDPGTSFVPNGSTVAGQDLDYRETSLILAGNQLLGEHFSFGVGYRLTHAQLDRRTTGLTPSDIQDEFSAYLHRVSLDCQYTHPSGFFAQFGAIWTQQSNQAEGDPRLGPPPDRPGDDFWHLNAFVGYRFLQRRVEAAVGVVNITDQDYRLSPLTLYSELPRQRSIYASLKFYFK